MGLSNLTKYILFLNATPSKEENNSQSTKSEQHQTPIFIPIGKNILSFEF